MKKPQVIPYTPYLGKGHFLSIETDEFYCDVCNQYFWQSPRRQKCLRKDVKCPTCSQNNRNERCSCGSGKKYKNCCGR